MATQLCASLAYFSGSGRVDTSCLSVTGICLPGKLLQVVRSGPRQYLQLIAAFRAGNVTDNHLTLATPGRMDQRKLPLKFSRSNLSTVHWIPAWCKSRKMFLATPSPCGGLPSSEVEGIVLAHSSGQLQRRHLFLGCGQRPTLRISGRDKKTLDRDSEVSYNSILMFVRP